jgi:Flp pilus assembly protein TadB
MAQAKKKRKSRHRGTQAGTVEARGRTSRPSGERKRSAPKKPANRAEAREQARQKRGALNRALFAAALFGILIVVAFQRPVTDGVALAGLMVFMYLPMSYYTDKFLYNRRQRQKQAGRG